MKLSIVLKSLAVGALALLASHQAEAQTRIYIVGSNGDRTATQTAISNILDAGWKFQGIGGNATSNTLSVATGANHGAWNGTFSGNPVVIKVNYSGALAGIAAVASSPRIPVKFVSSDGLGTGAVPDPTAAGTAPADIETATADFGFSTNFQSTSPYNGTFQGTTYLPLTEEVVGVSPLGFYASPGFPTTAANITTQQAQVLYSAGSISLFQFTGDYADVNKIVYAIGRNTDAGQRFGAYAEIGLGVTSAVKVWEPTYDVNFPQQTLGNLVYGGKVASHQLWRPTTSPGLIPVGLGSGGYPTGASLAPQLTTELLPAAAKGAYTDEDGNPAFLYQFAEAGYYIGYLTPSDALTRVLGQSGSLPAPNRGVALSYNGVALHNAVNGTGATVNFANIQNGKYTAWLYNRLLRDSRLTDTTKVNFANVLRNRIRDVDAPSGGGLLNDANFKVKRNTDGGLVLPK